MRYKVILLLILIFSCSIGFSQTKEERRLKRADASYERGEFYLSIQQYNAALRKIKNKKLKNEVAFKIGEAYYQIFDYKKAKSQYRKCLKDRNLEYFAGIKLGEISIQEGNFEDAVKIYSDVLEKYPEDSVAKQGIEAAKLAVEWSTMKVKYTIAPAKHLNSRDDDYCAFVDEKDGYDHIYFTSMRKEAIGKKSKINGGKLGDIFVTKFDKKNEWSKPAPLDSLNTKDDEGMPFITNNGKEFYFTRCAYEKGKNLGCQIYGAQKVDGDWMHPQRVEVVDDSISVGHPTFNSEGTIMYFSAHLDGGYGGTDIWYSEKTGDKWSKPKNMGPEINSKGDEICPFMRHDGTFYYSSTKPPTMGGLDIFKAYKNEQDQWVSENMQTPFNSNGNDYGVYFYSKQEKGYFSSDRKGTKGSDMFYFELIPVVFNLSGTVKDKDKKFVVDSALISLYGSDGSSFHDTILLQSKKDKFTFKLKKNTDYVFVVTKRGYFNGRSRFSTIGYEYSEEFKYDIILESFNKTFEIPNIEFEFGKWALTEPSKHTLDSIINILSENPSIVIELSAHTDMVGTDEDNMVLSQRRANSVTEYFQSKGCQRGRIEAVGYGESKPKVITQADNKYPFLKVGSVLDEKFINSLLPEEQVVANQQNRRIEMRVISNDYMPDLDW